MHVVRRDPLVLLAAAESRGQLELVRERLSEDYPDSLFVVVLPADPHVDVDGAVAGLGPAIREYVFTDTDSDGVSRESAAVASGHALAMRALEELGLGQDFVFTVPDLDDAIAYAITSVSATGHGWEADAVLVLASGTTVARLLQRL